MPLRKLGHPSMLNDQLHLATLQLHRLLQHFLFLAILEAPVNILTTLRSKTIPLRLFLDNHFLILIYTLTGATSTTINVFSLLVERELHQLFVFFLLNGLLVLLVFDRDDGS